MTKTGFVEMRIDSDIGSDGWCFCTPRSHPEDIKNEFIEDEWDVSQQIFAQVSTALPQDVIDLVIAAREFWQNTFDNSPEARALDLALEKFSSRVPYENQYEA